MKRKTEVHHVTPICMLGHDWVENTMIVTEYEHKLIHATLDIPYSKIRTFRKKTNHLPSRSSQQFVNELRKVHVAFFEKVNLLPPKLRNKMRDCIRETTKRIIREHSIELKTPADNAKLHSWLKSMHYALTLR